MTTIKHKKGLQIINTSIWMFPQNKNNEGEIKYVHMILSTSAERPSDGFGICIYRK